MPLTRVGVQLAPEHCDLDELRDAWRRADRLGVDSIWLWDHFFPINGAPDGRHFECMSLLAAMALETSRATIGLLVASITYRSPDLLADMTRTVDCLSGGRAVLGVGAGWSSRDHTEYGFAWQRLDQRVRALDDGLARIRARLSRLRPAPVGPIPILVGGGSERVLRVAARHADMWNGRGPVPAYSERNLALDDYCLGAGRHPTTLERTAQIAAREVPAVQRWIAAGASHIIVRCASPFDLDGVRELVTLRDAAPAAARGLARTAPGDRTPGDGPRGNGRL